MARPVTYKTVESMKKKADEYFEKCMLSDEIPNMLGLTLYLGFIDRHSLYHFSKNHKEFTELITSFKTAIENIIFMKMFSGEITKQQVISMMFYLKSVHGYRENEVKEYISISEILSKKRAEINNQNNIVVEKKKAGRPKKPTNKD